MIRVVIAAILFLSANALSTKLDGIEVESGTHIIDLIDDMQSDTLRHYQLIHPNASESFVSLPHPSNATELPKQWIAWYFKGSLGSLNGFSYMDSTFVVPEIPKGQSNIAIFNALQASYDPTNYNYILQPVLSRGSWMLGTSKGWTISAVMCNPVTNKCIFSKPIDTQPGHVIRGTITRTSAATNSYTFRVDITDLTAKSPTQSITFSTKYFSEWAFVSLEHNPEGAIKSCDELPTGSLVFKGNELQPPSSDFWQGSFTDSSCGVSVEDFPFNSNALTITL